MYRPLCAYWMDLRIVTSGWTVMYVHTNRRLDLRVLANGKIFISIKLWTFMYFLKDKPYLRTC